MALLASGIAQRVHVQPRPLPGGERLPVQSAEPVQALDYPPQGRRLARSPARRPRWRTSRTGLASACDVDRASALPRALRHRAKARLVTCCPTSRLRSPVTNLLNKFVDKKGQTRLLSYIAKGDRTSRRTQPPNIIRKTATPKYPSGHERARATRSASDDNYGSRSAPSDSAPEARRGDNPFSCDDDEQAARSAGATRAAATTRQTRHEGLAWRSTRSSWALHKTDWMKGGVHWRVATPGSEPRRRRPEYKIDRCDRQDPPEVCVRRRCAILGCARRSAVFTANIQPVATATTPGRGCSPFSHFEPGQYAGRASRAARGRTSAPAQRRARRRSSTSPRPG